MDKIIRIFEFAQHLFPDEHSAQQASEIIAGIIKARSTHLSDVAAKMAGNEAAGYKRIQRFLQDSDPREALKSPPTRIRVIGYSYLVDFGSSTQPRFHTVNKQRSCSCSLKETCPAIEAVAEYLCNGGQQPG